MNYYTLKKGQDSQERDIIGNMEGGGVIAKRQGRGVYLVLFGETFGKFWKTFVAPSSPPSPPQKKTVRNCIYCTVQNLLFAEIVIIVYYHWIF